jgi:hypothetical protein
MSFGALDEKTISIDSELLVANFEIIKAVYLQAR